MAERPPLFSFANVGEKNLITATPVKVVDENFGRLEGVYLHNHGTETLAIGFDSTNLYLRLSRSMSLFIPTYNQIYVKNLAGVAGYLNYLEA